ncbi:MAG: transporter substrate-binding domain-containing protein [Myxococcota bacterium]
MTRLPSSFSLLTLSLVVLLASSGCQTLGLGGPSDIASDRLGEIIERQTLRVGLTGSQPPLNMKTASGETIGLEIDLVRALAGSMALEIELVEKPFAELLPALRAGDVDLVISGMTITPERNARVAFAGPYFISGKSLLTKDASLARSDDPTKLDDASRTVAALAGSTSQEFVEQILPNAQLVAVDDYDAGVALVMDGKADALIADYPICEVSLLRHPDAGLATLYTPFTIEPLGIALPPDAPLFVNLVQNHLNTLENTGMLTRLKAKWFTDGTWVAELR